MLRAAVIQLDQNGRHVQRGKRVGDGTTNPTASGDDDMIVKSGLGKICYFDMIFWLPAPDLLVDP